MNCSPTIAIALLLMSLTAGTWFLYKTQKENLSVFFKFVAWFVIVASFLAMICCAMCCAMRCCMRHNECREMERCEMGGMGECSMGMHGGMNKRIMIMRGGEDGECDSDSYREKGGKCCGMCKEGKEECEGGEGEECKEGKMDCCKKGGDKCDMKMELKKDSVVKKK